MADPTSSTPPAADGTAQAKALMPFIGPLLAMAGQRKGFVVLGAIAFCTAVYFRQPDKLPLIFAFLGVVLPFYFGAQTSEDNNKRKHDAEIAVAQITPAPAPVNNVTNIAGTK